MNLNDNDEELQFRSRLFDFVEERQRMLPPVQGFEKMPLVSLEEAVRPLVSVVHDIEHQASLAKKNCKVPPAHGLSIDESASIRLYTMEWKPREKCLYMVLNTTLRSEDRTQLKDWFLCLKLMMTALSKIPSTTCRIFRGVKSDLSGAHPKREERIWWAFSSCTNSMELLEKSMFLGKTGARTRFEIDCYSAKDIHQHSYYPKEDERLLLPATMFHIKANRNAGDDLHIISLQECEPRYPLIDKVPFLNGIVLPKIIQPSSLYALSLANSTSGNSDLECYLDSCQLRSNVNLDELRLNDVDMSTVVDQAIINKQCTKLSLQDGELTLQGISILVTGIRESTTLEELNLSNNHLSDNDVLPLAQELSLNRPTIVQQWKCCGIAKVKTLETAPIKTLHLSMNNIGDEGAKYLAEVLKVKRTLLELYLNKNKISDTGVQFLASALCHSTANLQKLYLHNNPRITDSSVNYFLDIFKQNQSLNTLWLINCNLTDAGRQQLREGVASETNFYLNVENFH